ncbi:MAG: hypothetical protein CBB71_12900 [Rhodopirellula sp. TMED11]|nr:MAG: hypothetical protein CBB71_12900 [Rhodopirellula sp. TMED11]
MLSQTLSLRRTFMLCVVMSLATGRLSAAAPNVLMIVVDDMNDWVGCLGGHPDVSTPNIDRLAARGVLFSNAHCIAPVCNASRVATLTGRRPGSTGVYDNGAKWQLINPSLASLPQHFREHGYHVVGGGKVFHHMPGFNRQSDWHEYFAQRFDGHYQDRLHRGHEVSNFAFPAGFPLNGMSSVKQLARPPRNAKEFDWGPLEKQDRQTGDGKMVQWAVEFLKQPPDQPFFLAAGIYRPHLPFYAPKKYFQKYPIDSIKLAKQRADDLEDLPGAGKAMASQRREDYELVVREGKLVELTQAYLASISFADAMVGRLLDALDASGEADNTVVVLWSDHGWHLGEKQHLHKFTLWERSTRIPFIVSVPNAANAGVVCNRPVDLTCLMPTLSEVCGLPELAGLDGVSVSALLNDPAMVWTRPAITSHGPGNHAVRTDHWRYIHYANGDEELYDHRIDPNEWNNLAADPSFQQTLESLRRWVPTQDAKPFRRRKKAQ